MMKLEFGPENPEDVLAELFGERRSELTELGARPSIADVYVLPRIYDAAMEIAERDGCAPPLPMNFLERIVSLGAERLATNYAMTQNEIGDVTGRLYWARDVYKRALEYVMLQRRKERGPDDHAPIAIPHPELDIENKVDFGTYEYDVDQIYEAVRHLPDVAEKLLKIEPPREEYVLPLDEGQVAAIKLALLALREGDSVEQSAAPTLETLLEKRTVPGTMAVRSTATLLAWLRKNAGSPEATVVARGVKRKVLGSVTTIRPKTLQKRVDPIIPQPAIEGAA